MKVELKIISTREIRHDAKSNVYVEIVSTSHPFERLQKHLRMQVITIKKKHVGKWK